MRGITVCVARVQETDCTGGMTHTEWCNPCLTPDDRLHPTAYTADMVSQESMANMREVGLKMCNVSAAEDLAAVSFVSAAQLAAGQQCGQAPAPRCTYNWLLYTSVALQTITAPPYHDRNLS